MDPQGSYNLGENTAAYNFAEIWPFGGGGGCAASFEAATGNVSPPNMSANLDRDQLAPNPSGIGVRRRREEDSVLAGRVSTSCDNIALNECENNKRIKTAGGSNENRELRANEETTNTARQAEQKAKTAEPPKQDYIHVRARRGQATDSHSLAERARREKISERMKILQDLVPGCNKVIGKALVLDEIINYVQSLQRQVEFLSMKLEAVNSRSSPRIEAFPLKEFVQPPFDTSGMPLGSQTTREYDRDTSPEWLHMQIGGAFERTS